MFEIIIPRKEREVVSQNPAIFKQVYAAPIADYNTHQIKNPELEQAIGTEYIALKNFEKAYIEFSKYGRDSWGKFANNPKNHLILWPDLFKGADSVFLINAWLDNLIKKEVNPVTQEHFSQEELAKLKVFSKSSNKLAEEICGLMKNLFNHYKLPTPSFISSSKQLDS